jgi:aminodeoxyfutalosine synthase
MDAGLKRELEAKVYAGERLTRSDGIALQESDDLAWLGRLAHHKRTEIGGDRTLFAVNRRLDPANADDVAGRAEATAGAEETKDDQVTEVHIVNAVHSGRSWHSCPETLRALGAALPGVGLRGFSANDIRELEKISGLPAGEVLDELMSAGLESLAGDGAEIAGAGWEDWSRIHRLAHGKGMKTPASVHYRPGEAPIDPIVRLRELQDETGGFAVFIPLRESAEGRPAAPAETLKAFAVARLMFDNVPHIQSSTGTHDRSVAQLALNFGADEFDGSNDTLQRDDLLDLIWDAGFRPVERNTRYEVVREYDAAPSFTDRRSEPQQVWA